MKKYIFFSQASSASPYTQKHTRMKLDSSRKKVERDIRIREKFELSNFPEYETSKNFTFASRKKAKSKRRR